MAEGEVEVLREGRAASTSSHRRRARSGSAAPGPGSADRSVRAGVVHGCLRGVEAGDGDLDGLLGEVEGGHLGAADDAGRPGSTGRRRCARPGRPAPRRRRRAGSARPRGRVAACSHWRADGSVTAAWRTGWRPLTTSPRAPSNRASIRPVPATWSRAERPSGPTTPASCSGVLVVADGQRLPEAAGERPHGLDDVRRRGLAQVEGHAGVLPAGVSPRRRGRPCETSSTRWAGSRS